MNSHLAAGLLAAFMLASTASLAQEGEPAMPAQNAQKLSAIIAQVEQRDGFRYVSEIDWNEDGYYDVIYFTADKAKVEIKIDPVTGKPQ